VMTSLSKVEFPTEMEWINGVIKYENDVSGQDILMEDKKT